MSGLFESKSNQTTTQNSVTNPWAPATPALQGILGQVQSGLKNTGLTGNENAAIDSIIKNAGTANQFAPAIQNYATSLLQGGGANDQAGAVNQNYQNYYNQTNPLASNLNYNPYDTPGLKEALSTLTGDITQGINGQFAAAGRDFSGMNAQTLGRGLTQGLAPTLVNQFNANRTAQQGAAGNLYNAGNTNAGILSGMQQQYLQNQGQGIGASGAALDAQNNGANATLQAEAMRRNIPTQALGLLANIGVPIAGLGGTSSGTSNTTGTYSPGLMQSLIGAASGIGSAGTSLFGANPNGGIGAISKFVSDRNAKEDIDQVGTLFDGTPVYRFRYIGDPRFQIGLMAQDIEQRTPEAVGQIGPWKAVDYKLATDKALEVA